MVLTVRLFATGPDTKQYTVGNSLGLVTLYDHAEDGQVVGQWPEDEAGRMLAAAPDLLAALEILLADMEAEYRDRNGDADHDAMEKARAAVAKARGGT